MQRRTTPVDPYIYHHKWFFVSDDYQGFDVAVSKTRSEQWIALGDVDRSRIGRKSVWEENVVPGEANQIEFKKVGRAYHYRVSRSQNGNRSLE